MNNFQEWEELYWADKKKYPSTQETWIAAQQAYKTKLENLATYIRSLMDAGKLCGADWILRELDELTTKTE